MSVKRSTSSWVRRVGYGGMAAGMIVAVTALALTPVAAAPGNNGTIKVDEQGLENGPGAPNSNDPHIDCAGRVEWYGFDEGVQSSDVIFEVQAPTISTGAEDAPTAQTYEDVAVVDGDGPGGTSLDGTLDFDLSPLLAHYQPHPKQGYHVKVTAHTTFSQGSDVKHKVFWVQPCEGEEIGGLTIDKAVTGNDQPAADTEFEFTLDCELDGAAIDLNGEEAGDTATFTLTAAGSAESFPLLPAGATCTVAESDDQDADTTSWTVDGGAPTIGSSVVVVIGADATAAVLATNAFDTVTLVPTPPAAVLPTPPIERPVTPEGPVTPAVPEAPAPSALPAAQVQGEVITRPAELPRTGASTLPMVQIGLGMILLGAGAVLWGRVGTALV